MHWHPKSKTTRYHSKAFWHTLVSNGSNAGSKLKRVEKLMARGRKKKIQKCKYTVFLMYLYIRTSPLNAAGRSFLWLTLEQQTRVEQMLVAWTWLEEEQISGAKAKCSEMGIFKRLSTGLLPPELTQVTIHDLFIHMWNRSWCYLLNTYMSPICLSQRYCSAEHLDKNLGKNLFV